MRITRHLLTLTLLLIALPGIATAADPEVEQAKARLEQAQGDYKAAKSKSRAQAKATEAQKAQARNTYETEVATIKAQADAADAQCARQAESSQRDCRKSVHRDSQRATQAAKAKYEQALKALQ